MTIWIAGSILIVLVYIMWLITFCLKELEKIREVLEKDANN